MKSLLTVFVLLVSIYTIQSQSDDNYSTTNSTVENVYATVQNKNIVVNYTLTSALYGQTFNIELWYSVNYNNFEKCRSIKCSDGACYGITAGYNKSITWNVLQDLSVLDANTLVFEVYAIAANSSRPENAYSESTSNTFSDDRDYHNYKWVQIGNQTWMAENVAYKPTKGTCWAVNNDENNTSKYGYLYDWETAKEICPTGWHLPSNEEWDKLVEFLGSGAGGKMKTTTGWKYDASVKADNSSGFSGLPAGIRNEYDFYNFGEHAYFWTSTRSGRQFATARFLSHYGNDVSSPGNYRTDGYSVRCLKD